MNKILFICECNICRSPMAEFIFKSMTTDIPDIEIASAGISGEKEGSDMYDMAKDCLTAHNIPFEPRQARVFRINDYFDYDLIICMDEWTKQRMKTICADDPENKIYKLLEFSGMSAEEMSEDEAIIHTDIFDPYQDKNFERAYEEISDACELLKLRIILTTEIERKIAAFAKIIEDAKADNAASD